MRRRGRHARYQLARLALWAGSLGTFLTAGGVAVAQTGLTVRPRPTTVVFSKPAGSLSVTPGARPPQRLVLGDPYVTNGFIRKELPTAATGTPYVSGGVLKVETDARGAAILAAPAKPPAKTPVKTDSRMRRRIQHACGSSAKNVEVFSESPTSLRVRFQVRDLDYAEIVSRQVLQLPELLPYQVAFEVHVAR